MCQVTANTAGGEREVFEELSNVVTPPKEGLGLGDLVRLEDPATQRARVRFLTPTTLKRNGKLVDRPSFTDLWDYPSMRNEIHVDVRR